MKKRYQRLTASGLILLAIGGCSGARREIASKSLGPIVEADSVTLYSIDPRSDRHAKDVKTFHGNPILGTVDISATAVRNTVLAALRGGIEQCRMDSGYDCFWPRHGIRVRRGRELTDYVICFECAQILVYDDKDSEIDYILTTNEPQPALDRIFAANGIPLAPKK